LPNETNDVAPGNVQGAGSTFRRPLRHILAWSPAF
jgi:hypothetical protein